MEDRVGSPPSVAGSPLQSILALLLAICGGLAFIFLFFALLGAVDFEEAAVATIVAGVLALVWLAGFLYRWRTKAGRVQWRDRERRGF